ncbi:SDR family NAD(P)-dependent oxidoreductase [Amycolatopsis pithecellobii]|uniref:SDR family oxidoreductase n=1 Tax=Amycolatopsis pithecellobii TaxID=664692 RepID=A0A6N7Z2W8_9PSEU|nr:SDR family NAD(P)-dependent oxidoreductase [Amycolatopsis pithecellobii]MTD54254.1 SDR family oxidoreductase [Amycolatopsis pithecellobii]
MNETGMTTVDTPNWTERSAIVTGAASGIGAAVAAKLAARGVAVTAATLRAGEGGEGVVKQIIADGGRAQLAFGDVSDESAVAGIFSAATESFGPPDIVVHAAGGLTSIAATAQLEPAEWDRMVAINLRSAFLVIHAALPGMIERGWGRVVTVASEAGRMPTRVGSSAYAAAKSGVIGLTKHVAREIAAHGVTVNATAPSTTLSPRIQALYPDGGAAVGAQHPMGRLAEPDEQAAAILFLCSPEASYVNGACLDVTGGSVNI